MKCTECNKELTMGEEEYYKKSERPKLNLPPHCLQCAILKREAIQLKVNSERVFTLHDANTNKVKA